MAYFNFIDLDSAVRKAMLDELESDIQNHKLYISSLLTDQGREQYPQLLREALSNGNDESFETVLISGEHFLSHTIKNGKTQKVPSNAALRLAQGEFNRYYIRGLCLICIAEGNTFVQVYRGRESSQNRPESEAMIGKIFDAETILSDLRESIGATPEILPEIASGLTVKRVVIQQNNTSRD